MKGYSLQDLLQEVGRYKLKGDWEGEVKGVAIDSRKVVKHGVFIAIDGSMSDGHAYVNDALEAGAVIVICEKWPEHIQTHSKQSPKALSQEEIQDLVCHILVIKTRQQQIERALKPLGK